MNKSKIKNLKSRIRNPSGFTLIEVAIVLVVLGLLIGLGARLVGPLTKRVKFTESREIVDAAVQSVISYGAGNNRIPTTGEFADVVSSPRDAFTKDLYYIPDDNLDDAGSTICGRKTTGITVRDCTNETCTSYNDISDTAFVVVSGSMNRNIQTDNISNTVKIYEFGSADIDDCQDSNDCPSAATESQEPDRQESYDDIVKWINLDELRTKVGCVGPPLKILNNELPFGTHGSSYSSAAIIADGGVPFSSGGNYRWCREESASTGLTFNPSTLNADCSGLSEASWGQADSLAISGTPTASGSFSITFFGRDNNDPSGVNDNIAQKTFVLTIHPSS